MKSTKTQASTHMYEESSFKNTVHYHDFGKEFAFLSIADLVEIKANGIEVPTVKKETSQAAIGALKSGSSPGPDRYKAAKAYAAMLETNSESKACASAARWLQLPISVVTYKFECSVRNALRMVSEKDSTNEEKIAVPAYIDMSAMSSELTAQEMEMWNYGITPQNRDVYSRLVSVVRGEKGAWILCATGGKSMGFDESEGDYDFICANKDASADPRPMIEAFKRQSRSGTVLETDHGWGKLIKMKDVLIGDFSVNVDIVFPKLGLASTRVAAAKSIFWKKLLKETNGLFVREFFVLLRDKARQSGVLCAATGGLSMWSFMIRGLEYLFQKGIILYDLNHCLGKQDVIVEGMMQSGVTMGVKECLVMFANDLRNPNHVVGNFSHQDEFRVRGTSEFRKDTRARVMRDPFDHPGINIVRSLTKSSISSVILGLQHIAACDAKGHPWPSGADLVLGDSEELDDIPTLSMNTRMEGPKIHYIGQTVIAFIKSRMSFGIGKSDEEASGRCLRNALLDLTKAYIQMGPAFMDEIDGQGGALWFLERMGRIHLIVDVHYDSDMMMEDVQIEVGLCARDTYGERMLKKASLREIELVMGMVYEQNNDVLLKEFSGED